MLYTSGHPKSFFAGMSTTKLVSILRYIMLEYFRSVVIMYGLPGSLITTDDARSGRMGSEC